MPGAHTERLLTEVGRSFEAGSDKPFLFSGGGGWYVRSGSVDVFSVRVEGGRAVGSRSHFFRAGAGQFLFGLGGDDARTVGLLAVGTSGTQMIEVDQEQLRRLAASSAHSDHMAVMVDGWVEALCSSITGGKILDECVVIEAGEHAAADGEAARVRPSKSTLWIRSEDGTARLLGREGLEVAASSLTPISRHAWLEVPPKARIVAQPSSALIGGDELWAGLGQLHDLVLDYVVQRDRQAVAAERERLRQKAAADRSTFADACASIAETLDASGERQRRLAAGPQLSRGDDLITACGMLADTLGIEIKPLPAGDGPIPRDPLAALARASRFRTRQVLLRDEWWRSDGGPMLAYLKEPRRPVVLMPTRSGYVMRDPADGSETRVKAALADQLEPQAQSFYRPFREHALSLLELVKFGLGGCGRDVATVVVMAAATGLLGLVTPIVTGILFNDVIPGADRPQLLQLTLIMLVIAVATTLFNASGTIALVRVDGRMGASIQSAVWDRLLALPMPFFRRYTAGDLASRAMGIDSIRQVLSGAVVTSLLTGLFSLFHFGLLFHYSERLAWWAVVIIVVAVAATAVAGRLQVSAERDVAKIRTKLSGAVLQFLSSISKLRVAGAEIKAFSLWAQGFSRQRRFRFRARAVSNALASFNSGFPLAAQLALFAFAVPLLTADVPLRTGDFLAFMVSFATCLSGMLSASGALIGAATVIPLYEQATPILSTLPEVDSGKADPGALAGHVEMQSLRFRYQPDGPLILDDVKLTIRPGEFVALVGPSGSGKSTILRLLLGFEEPEAGAIFYDGQELAGLDHQAVRSQIGVVLQNGRLMPGDVFSNIVGSSLATLDDAWGAARMAGLDADVEAMPMGMHTVISEGGGTLSGGQRQRLMIARALVRRPKLLFFDEATSALDNRTQSIVSESLDRMQSTRVVVAHRLSTIIHADRIYVLEAGKVVQAGTYEELLDREGLFRELAMRQIA